jgi:hypothetical protein
MSDSSDLMAALESTAALMRQTSQRPRQPILVTFPYNPERRAQFEQEQRDFQGASFVFDWSLWPISERPGKAMTRAECAQICERVNARLAAVSHRSYAAASARATASGAGPGAVAG